MTEEQKKVSIELNAEKVREQKRRNYLKHKEEISARRKEKWATNPEIREKAKIYKQNNGYKEYMHEYRKKNAERIAIQQRAYAALHKEERAIERRQRYLRDKEITALSSSTLVEGKL